MLNLPHLVSGDLVYLKWHDSSNLSGWVYAPVSLELGVIESAGIVVEASPGLLIIAAAMNETGSTLNPLAIPANSIIEIRKLEKHGAEDARAEQGTCRQAC